MKRLARALSHDLLLRWGNRFISKQDVPWHQHAETELVAVTRGRCRIWTGEDAVFEEGRGALFVLPARVAQYQETIGTTCTTYIGFDAPSGLFDERPRVLHFELADPALLWLEQLCDSHLSRPPLAKDVTRSLLAALLGRIGDMDIAVGFRSQMHPAVQMATSYLESHWNEPQTLAGIAIHACVSASHLSALFAAEFGVGPIQYLKRLRIERACWLLSNPYLRVHEVAEACGYDDVNYFTRLFRQYMGIAPARWRIQGAGSIRNPGEGPVSGHSSP